MEKVIFQPNMPVRMALKYADGKTVEGRFGDQEYFTLTDSRCMYVNPDVAAKVYELGLKPGEPFEICRYWSGKKGDSPQWDVRRVDALPKDHTAAAAVATSIDETALERDLRRSLEQRATNGKPRAGVAAPAPEATALSQVPSPAHFHQNGSKLNGYTNGAAPTPDPPAGRTPALRPCH